MLLTDPVVLENAFVRLEPLDASHAADLDEARRGLDYAWYTSVPASAADEIAHRLAEHAAGRMNPFAVIAGGRPVGMTTLCNIDQPNRRTARTARRRADSEDDCCLPSCQARRPLLARGSRLCLWRSQRFP